MRDQARQRDASRNWRRRVPRPRRAALRRSCNSCNPQERPATADFHPPPYAVTFHHFTCEASWPSRGPWQRSSRQQDGPQWPLLLCGARLAYDHRQDPSDAGAARKCWPTRPCIASLSVMKAGFFVSFSPARAPTALREQPRPALPVTRHRPGPGDERRLRNAGRSAKCRIMQHDPAVPLRELSLRGVAAFQKKSLCAASPLRLSSCATHP